MLLPIIRRRIHIALTALYVGLVLAVGVGVHFTGGGLIGDQRDTPRPIAAIRQAIPAHALPIEGSILAEADIPNERWQSGHRGVDIAAHPGDAIAASRGGTVHFAGVVAGTPVVSILHNDGLRTTYEPVIATVSRGEHVRKGQVIGHLADAQELGEHARRASGLSWGAKWDGDLYIDPLSLLGDPVIVLKE